MACEFTGTIYIPYDELVGMVLKHNPMLNSGGEWAMGNIRDGGDSLEIDFSYSDFRDPRKLKAVDEFVKEGE